MTTLHAFEGNGTWCAKATGRATHCGYTVENTTHHYMPKAHLYWAATAGRPLPDTFAISMRYWLIKDATMVEIPGRDNVRTDVFTTALRAVIGTAEEWRLVAEASKELGQESTTSTAPNDLFLAGMLSGENHRAIYCANILLRTIARELYAEHVSEEERHG